MTLKNDQAEITLLADAMVDALNSNQGSFDVRFTASRKFVPNLDLEDMDEVQVIVVPTGSIGERQSRKEIQNTHEVQVGVMLRLVETITDKQHSQMLAFVQQVVDFFTIDTTRHLTIDSDNSIDAAGTGVYEWDPIFVPEHIRQWNQFTAAPLFEFIVWRSN